MTDRSQLALEIALELGFDLAGIAPLAPPPAAARFEAWLAAGHHGAMDYLERQRERILEPRRVLPEGRSLLVVGWSHGRPPVALSRREGGPRLARYAAGRDYHNWVGKRLRKLARRLEAEGFAGPSRGIVDAGPLLERSHAAAAGLGFESKAANLLAPRLGPWFFLGELLLAEELTPTPAPPAGSCGTCTACLDACPTAALIEPGLLDARRCISYLTIEQRGPMAHELRAGVGPWAFGCDVCSEVCPWGREAPDASERLGDHPSLAGEGVLQRWLAPDFDPRAELNGSPLQRPRRAGLARNAAVVLGNLPQEPGRQALEGALEDSDPSVRGAALWALAQRDRSDDARARLDAVLARESDAQTAADMRRSLEETA